MKRIVKNMSHLLTVRESTGISVDKEGTCMSVETITDDIFKEMDFNNDGLISQEEFVNGILSNKKLSTMLTLKIIAVFE